MKEAFLVSINKSSVFNQTSDKKMSVNDPIEGFYRTCFKKKSTSFLNGFESSRVPDLTCHLRASRNPRPIPILLPSPS